MLENRGLEIIILAVVVLLLFGAKRLPDSARALGKSLRILKSEATTAEPVIVPKTIQAAPGEAATARPVAETVAAEPTPATKA